MTTIIKIVVLMLFAVGALVVFLADKIEKKYGLGKKESIKDSEQFEEKEIENLKRQKAVIRVKMFGLVFLLPGIIGILILFD